MISSRNTEKLQSSVVFYDKTIDTSNHIIEFTYDEGLLPVIQSVENSIGLKAIDAITNTVIILKEIEEKKRKRRMRINLASMT